MASTREWFETVEEARRRARRRLPRSVYMALVAGSEKGVTLKDNLAAFSELRFAPPRIANLPAARDLATSVLGQDIALPVIASPTGVQAVHPRSEEHTSELQSHVNLVCRLLLEKKKQKTL